MTPTTDSQTDGQIDLEDYIRRTIAAAADVGSTKAKVEVGMLRRLARAAGLTRL